MKRVKLWSCRLRDNNINTTREDKVLITCIGVVKNVQIIKRGQSEFSPGQLYLIDFTP